MYHAEISHASAIMALVAAAAGELRGPGRAADAGWPSVSSPNGHGDGLLHDRELRPGRPRGPRLGASNRDMLEERLGASRDALLRATRRCSRTSRTCRTARCAVAAAWGPCEIEVWAWGVVPKEAPPEIKEAHCASTSSAPSAHRVCSSRTTARTGTRSRRCCAARPRSHPLNARMGLGHRTPISATSPVAPTTCSERRPQGPSTGAGPTCSPEELGRAWPTPANPARRRHAPPECERRRPNRKRNLVFHFREAYDPFRRAEIAGIPLGVSQGGGMAGLRTAPASHEDASRRRPEMVSRTVDESEPGPSCDLEHVPPSRTVMWTGCSKRPARRARTASMSVGGELCPLAHEATL